ncbi:MAG TPA: zinc ABC transporter substrate-binding protein, partial [bacterium]|nr:zinc ABC transporter substrate-binding protein [bacterium]
MKKFILTMILVLTLTQSFAQEKPDVVVSFFPLYDFTRNIGGDRIDLTSLIPFSVEPHDWEPGPRDMVKVSSADIFIYNGAGLEPWADDIIK